MNIAFIGLGNMGGRMAQNLLKAGLKVYGYDLSEVAIQHFAEAGGGGATAHRTQLNKQM
ncbi:3-hydroxyisobutyrate dehydrogenase [Acinetobacter baumannii]|nr:3-hydroxyisobutyrate dehydrogenase [Acinetobacter baumannii]